MKRIARGFAVLLAAIFASTGIPAAQIFAAEANPREIRTAASAEVNAGSAAVCEGMETAGEEGTGSIAEAALEEAVLDAETAAGTEAVSAGGETAAEGSLEEPAAGAGEDNENPEAGGEALNQEFPVTEAGTAAVEVGENAGAGDVSGLPEGSETAAPEDRAGSTGETISGTEENAAEIAPGNEEASGRKADSEEEEIPSQQEISGRQTVSGEEASDKQESPGTADSEEEASGQEKGSGKEDSGKDGSGKETSGKQEASGNKQTSGTEELSGPEAAGAQEKGSGTETPSGEKPAAADTEPAAAAPASETAEEQPEETVLVAAGKLLAPPVRVLLAAAGSVDNSTTLEDGEYTDFEFLFEGGTGKARLTLEKIVVKNGKATGVFKASSKNFTHAYYLGHTDTNDDDPVYYDPVKDVCGNGVIPIQNQSVEFPVALNASTDIACRTTAMSEPHWINYNYTITITEPEQEPADYSAVDQATQKAQKIDRSLYTKESLEALDKAVDAVVTGKLKAEQSEVDAMAEAIEKAIESLVLNIEDGRIDLTVTNSAGIPPVESAYVQKKGQNISLYLLLKDGSCRYLFKGTFEQAAANGNNTRNWIAASQNKDGKWQFLIPVASGESEMTFVAVSQSAYEAYLNNGTPLERAFYPVQFTLDLKNKTLQLSEYSSTQNLTVINRAAQVLPKSAQLATCGGPNSADYSCTLSLTMENKDFDQLFVGSAKDAKKASGKSIFKISGKTFTLPARWMTSAGKPETMKTIIGSAVTFSFHSAKYDIWYERTVTIDEEKGTILFKSEQKAADYSAVDEAIRKAEEVNREIYTAKSLKAMDKAVAAVVRDLPDTGQKLVNAMAKAIENAIKNLELNVKDGRTYLTITNTTGMFKAESAYVLKKGNKMTLVMTLSGNGYHDLFKGTYEQAVANGSKTENWIHGKLNSSGKWEFQIPLEAGETFIPCVAISYTYYEGYLNGENPLERSFFPRQLEINLKKKTLVTGDYAYKQELKITNNVTMFKPKKAALETLGGPNSNHYSSNLILTMGSDAFDKAFLGDKESAAKAAPEAVYEVNGRTFTIPVRWLAEFGKPDSLVSLIGRKAILSFHSVRLDQWYERAFTIDEEKGTIVFDPVEEGAAPVDPVTPPTPGQEEEKEEYEDTTGGATAAVDNSTGLADGTYTPDKFSFSGGTGRIVITCDQVEVRDGKAYATIVFQNVQSGSTEMTYVKASGGTYYCTQSGGISMATIPVELNKNNSILAMTTKMSAAHEIPYTIFVYIAGGEAKGGSNLAQSDSLDEEAPEIAGLEYQDEETLEHAEYFKVYNYSDGIRLLEIDMRTAEEKEKAAEEEETSSDAKESAESEETVIDEETGAEISLSASRADSQAELYKGKVVKYLIVPEDVEIPAGLDKETIVIQLPIESVYSGSEEITKLLVKLGLKDLIKSQPEEDPDNEEIEGAGTYDKLKVKKLVKSKCDLAILPSECLKDKKEREVFDSLSEDLANLDIVVMVDRSADEKTKEAKAEWLKVYGILFGCEEAAQQAYEEALK